MKQLFRKVATTAGVAFFVLGSLGAKADTIVNIKGFDNDGAGANIFAYPVAPGTVVDLFNPVLVDLQAGDYLIADAWGKAGALYDAWNFQIGAAGSWASHFVAAKPLGGNQYSVLIDGISLLEPTCKNHFCAWDTQAEAAAAFAATPPFRLHLAQDTTVAFVSADYYLPDNSGGISLSVTAVPEPESWAMLLAGLTVLGLRRRRANPFGAESI